MSKLKMDAIEVATSIRKGDFSKLRGKSFEMCDNTNMGNKYTLNQLGLKVDRLEKTIDKLAKIASDGFAELRQDIKDINARLDYNGLQIEQINKRLDYNNLKKLPESNK